MNAIIDVKIGDVLITKETMKMGRYLIAVYMKKKDMTPVQTLIVKGRSISLVTFLINI